MVGELNKKKKKTWVRLVSPPIPKARVMTTAEIDCGFGAEVQQLVDALSGGSSSSSPLDGRLATTMDFLYDRSTWEQPLPWLRAHVELELIAEGSNGLDWLRLEILQQWATSPLFRTGRLAFLLRRALKNVSFRTATMYLDHLCHPVWGDYPSGFSQDVVYHLGWVRPVLLLLPDVVPHLLPKGPFPFLAVARWEALTEMVRAADKVIGRGHRLERREDEWFWRGV